MVDERQIAVRRRADARIDERRQAVRPHVNLLVGLAEEGVLEATVDARHHQRPNLSAQGFKRLEVSRDQ